MSEPTDRGTPPRPAPAALARRPWITPAVEKIDAGQAEVGTRAHQDGAFTSS